MGTPVVCVSSLKRRTNSSVSGPGFPAPMVRPSTSTTGTTSAAVPVRQTSSATYTWYGVSKSSLTLSVLVCRAISMTLFRIQPYFVRNDEQRRVRAVARVQPEVAGSPGDDQADVGVPKPVGAQRRHDRRLELPRRPWDLQQDRPGGIEQPVDVLMQFKH